jgi:stage II sporulation protein D
MVKRGIEIYDMALEEYLLGVLAAEMPASFEPEALKAQAVAARSYTLYCAWTGKHKGAQVCTDYSCCQAWKSEEQMLEDWGENYEKNREKLSSAIEETAGEYLAYQGEAVFSAFHSSSAGRTEDCGAIWSALPYLVSVDSPEGEENVPGYISRVELSELDFRDTLLHACPEADFSGDAGRWIGEIILEDSGRVASVLLGGCLFTGTRLRELFSLRSTAFTLEYTDGIFVFTVTGYGHGVGMSQYGAKLMAAQGADYTAILAHYYPGTSLVT